jgi:hypothetical protein
MKLDQFKHSVALDALSLTSVLTPLLHQYRTGLDQAVLANRVKLEMSVGYEEDVEDSWLAVPADGEYGFMKAAVRVSVQLQKTMRCWLQMHWFADADNFADTAKTAQLGAYLACKPYYPKAKNAYSYDLLDDWSTSAIDRSIRVDLPDVLSRVSSQLRILGRHELADFYNPSHTSWFVREIDRNGRLFYELLTRESRIVRAWVPYIGAKMSERQIEEARRETRIALNGIFHRAEDLGYLQPVFEIEAVAAIEAYIGRKLGRQLRISGNPETAPQSMAKVIPFPTPEELDRLRRRVHPYELVEADKAA